MSKARRILLMFVVAIGSARAAGAHPADPIVLQQDSSTAFRLLYPSRRDFPESKSISACKERIVELAFSYECEGDWKAEFTLSRQTMIVRSDGLRSRSDLVSKFTVSPGTVGIRASPSETVLNGALHVVFGADHILILILILSFGVHALHALVILSGFTIGHGIALLAAVLGVYVDPWMAEILIALSILMLAAEAYRSRAQNLGRKKSLSIVYTIPVGVIHGSGFVSVFVGMGLESPWGFLFWTHAGIELAQIGLVLLYFVIKSSVGRFGILRRGALQPSWVPRVTKGLIWGAGVLASFWFWQRL